MNKEQALQKLDALEKEAQELRKIIEAPEKEDSLLPPMGKGLNPYISWVKFSAGNQKITQEYEKAIETFFLLRYQAGSEVSLDGKMQYLIRLDKNRGLYVDGWQHIGNKVTAISPCFRTVYHAEKAIIFIGTENIIHMIKTFHGLYE